MLVTKQPWEASKVVSDDRGVILVLGVLLLTGLLAMAALAVDLGGVYNARSQDQSAADSAALAAAQDLPNRAAAVATAKHLASSTLGDAISEAKWDSCTSLADGYIGYPGTSCIGFNGSGRRVIVQIPVRQYQTVFAPVIGINSISHSAFAIAGVVPRGFGNVLPLMLTAGETAVYECLSEGGPTDECKHGGVGTKGAGNFGTLNFAYMGNQAAGTTRNCGNGNQKSRLINNMAVGVDHDLSVFNGSQRVDTVLCQYSSGEVPNSAETITGNPTNEAPAGLFTGGAMSDGNGPRLSRLGQDPSTPAWMRSRKVTDNNSGKMLDNIPLWEYLPTTDSSRAVPRSCARDQFESAANPTASSSKLPEAVGQYLETTFNTVQDRELALTERCLVHYLGETWIGEEHISGNNGNKGGNGEATDNGFAGDPPCVWGNNASGREVCSPAPASSFTEPIFSRRTNPGAVPALWDIQYSPRFGYSPRISSLPNGKAPVNFTSFSPVFIQTLIGKKTSFDPGSNSSSVSLSDSQYAVSTFVLPHGSLPGKLGEANAPYLVGVNRFIELIR